MLNRVTNLVSTIIKSGLFNLITLIFKAEAYLGSPRASKIEVLVTIVNSSQDSEGLF